MFSGYERRQDGIIQLLSRLGIDKLQEVRNYNLSRGIDVEEALSCSRASSTA